MSVSQRPFASTLLRIARKISPSDQCFNRPAGVRLEDTNDPIGIGKSSPMSRPPVSVPALEWQALQEPSTRALPRAIRSGVASTLRSGTGARRTCCLTMPTIVRAATVDTATTNTAARPTPPHFRNLLLPRQAQSPDQTSNAAAATIASKATVLTIVHRPRSSPLEIQQKELSGLVALMGLVAPHRSNNIQPSDVGVLDDLACHGH